MNLRLSGFGVNFALVGLILFICFYTLITVMLLFVGSLVGWG